jgi:hypothetical protein
MKILLNKIFSVPKSAKCIMYNYENVKSFGAKNGLMQSNWNDLISELSE